MQELAEAKMARWEQYFRLKQVESANKRFDRYIATDGISVSIKMAKPMVRVLTKLSLISGAVKKSGVNAIAQNHS